jgi:hypothetical protein
MICFSCRHYINPDREMEREQGSADCPCPCHPRPSSGYPRDWPRCACGRPVLDGHLTCGRLTCDESGARANRVDAWRASRWKDSDHEPE